MIAVRIEALVVEDPWNPQTEESMLFSSTRLNVRLAIWKRCNYRTMTEWMWKRRMRTEREWDWEIKKDDKTWENQSREFEKRREEKLNYKSVKSIALSLLDAAPERFFFLKGLTSSSPSSITTTAVSALRFPAAFELSGFYLEFEDEAKGLTSSISFSATIVSCRILARTKACLVRYLKMRLCCFWATLV